MDQHTIMSQWPIKFSYSASMQLKDYAVLMEKFLTYIEVYRIYWQESNIIPGGYGCIIPCKRCRVKNKRT